MKGSTEGALGMAKLDIRNINELSGSTRKKEKDNFDLEFVEDIHLS